MTEEKVYRQSLKAVYLSYLPLKWFWAMCLIFVPVLCDYLRWKNTEMRLENKFLVFKTGVFTTFSKEIPYEDIKSVNVLQPIIGKFFNYGTISINMTNAMDTIVMKNVNNPEVVRREIQNLYVKSQKVKLA